MEIRIRKEVVKDKPCLFVNVGGHEFCVDDITILTHDIHKLHTLLVRVYHAGYNHCLIDHNKEK